MAIKNFVDVKAIPKSEGLFKEQVPFGITIGGKVVAYCFGAAAVHRLASSSRVVSDASTIGALAAHQEESLETASRKLRRRQKEVERENQEILRLATEGEKTDG